MTARDPLEDLKLEPGLAPESGKGKQNANGPDQRPLKGRAQTLLDKAKPAAELTPRLEGNYVIKGWLNSGDLSIVYGAPGAGKSFLALDISSHVAAGREWNGCKVRGGMVIYLAAEGGHGFGNRVVALEGEKSRLWTLEIGLDLCKPDTDTSSLIEMIQHLSAHHGPYVLIVVDTLARAMGSGNENDSADMGALVRHIDKIRAATGAHALLVHHVGKDDAKEARGHSSLKAATDTEIKLTRDGETITAEVKKQRDTAAGRSFHYTLKRVELGQDEDGDPVTTCVVEPCAAPDKPTKTKDHGLGKNQRRVLEALRQYVDDYGQKNPGGTGWPERGAVRIVDRKDFLAFAAEKMTNDDTDIRKKVAGQALNALIERSLIAINAGKIWLIPERGGIKE